jgi:tRNA (guanine10-N2)-methyltransferase
MDFLIKFASEHESFRLPEIEALADLEGVDLEVKEYNSDVRKTSYIHNTSSSSLK